VNFEFSISKIEFVNSKLFSDYLDYQVAMPRPVIEIQVNNLLPGPQSQASFHEGHSKRRAQQGCTHMTMPVAITPGCIMRVGAVRGDDLIKKAAQILNQARLIFHGCQRAGGGWAKDGDRPVLQAALANDLSYFPSQIVDIRIASGAQLNRSCHNTHTLYYSNSLMQKLANKPPVSHEDKVQAPYAREHHQNQRILCHIHAF
jgi:hypothetical protein